MAGKGHSYILCSTPRTGSTFLCSLLKATNVAGKPESYFRSQDVDARVEDWNIREPDGSYRFRDFLNCVRERGRTDNGVFAARIMWGTMQELTDDLRSIGMAGGDLDVLSEAFGPLKFVYLERQDVLAQAISRLRAEQTNVWHIKDTRDWKAARNNAHYDREAIRLYIDESIEHAREWHRWFRKNDVVPLRLRYEDLDIDGQAEAHRVLNYIGVEPPLSTINAPDVRMADRTSEEWAERFRAETQYAD